MKKLKFALSIIAFFVVLNTADAKQIEQKQILTADTVNDLQRAPISFAGGISMGATQAFPTGGLSNYFTPAIGFSISLGFSINRFYIGFQTVSDARMRLSKPLSESIYLQEGERFIYRDLTFPIGYTLIKGNRFELMPFVGIGRTTMRRFLHNYEFYIADTFTISPGLRTEFQLARFNLNDPTMPSSLNFRLDVGYNMPMRFNYTPARGNVFYARAAIVWWFGDI